MGGVEIVPESDARRLRCQIAPGRTRVVPADTRRGKAPGERPPVTYSHRREDRWRASTRFRGSRRMPTRRGVGKPFGPTRAPPGGTHGCAQCESWVGARLRSAPVRSGGNILMGQERFRTLKVPSTYTPGLIRSVVNQFRISSNRSAKYRYIGTTDRMTVSTADSWFPDRGRRGRSMGRPTSKGLSSRSHER